MKSNTEKESNQRKGDSFEAYVASIYESMGYQVKLNLKLSGQQVDVLAEKIFPGAGLSKIAIECKYLSLGSVGNQVVFDSFDKSASVINTYLPIGGINK